MGGGVQQFFHGMSSWVENATFSDDTRASIASSASNFTDDAVSVSSSLSSSSATSNSSSYSPDPDSNGPLYELSSLMAQLPIKRGLSKYFQGKSQSFTSLSSPRCIEDLAKKESPFKRKMKACKSYGRGLDSDLRHKSYYAPMACSRIISKKASRGLCASLMIAGRSRSSLLVSCNTPSIPIQKKL